RFTTMMMISRQDPSFWCLDDISVTYNGVELWQDGGFEASPLTAYYTYCNPNGATSAGIISPACVESGSESFYDGSLYKSVVIVGADVADTLFKLDSCDCSRLILRELLHEFVTEVLFELETLGRLPVQFIFIRSSSDFVSVVDGLNHAHCGVSFNAVTGFRLSPVWYCRTQLALKRLSSRFSFIRFNCSFIPLLRLPHDPVYCCGLLSSPRLLRCWSGRCSYL
ncbi:unnamed protein product, partial [Adineta steineri]